MQEPGPRPSDIFTVQFHKDPEKRINLAEFTQLTSLATGIQFQISAETQVLLERAKLGRLEPTQIHKNAFYEFFRSQLLLNNFECIEVEAQDSRTVAIRTMDAEFKRLPSIVLNQATMVDPSNLQAYCAPP